MNLYHAEAKFECRYCNAAYITAQAVTKHEHEAHLGPWYKCRKCSKTFKSTWSHARHKCVSAAGEAANENKVCTFLHPDQEAPS